MSTKNTVNDTTFNSGGGSGGGWRERWERDREASENTLPVFHVSYTVLFLTLNILRLSQMGHKPPALLSSG